MILHKMTGKIHTFIATNIFALLMKGDDGEVESEINANRFSETDEWLIWKIPTPTAVYSFLLLLPSLCHLRKIYLNFASLISFDCLCTRSPRIRCVLNVPSINNKSLSKIRWDTFDIVKLQRCGQIFTLKSTERITSIHMHISMHLHFDESYVDEMWCNRLSFELHIKMQLNEFMIGIVCTTNETQLRMYMNDSSSWHWRESNQLILLAKNMLYIIKWVCLFSVHSDASHLT